MKRKTIDVEKVKEFANFRLSCDQYEHQLVGICCLLEDILDESRQYKGFIQNPRFPLGEIREDGTRENDYRRIYL